MSPAGATGGGGTPAWKLNVNNGTDLWEANLRNGGAPPPAPPTSKTPWGYTPTKNIGGTWGEEDDTPDQSNVWTAPPVNNAPGASAPTVSNSSSGNADQMQWGMNNGPQQTPNNAGGGMWNSAPMTKDQNSWRNSGRMDGGNRHSGHFGADKRGAEQNRPTARGWDVRNQSQLNNGTVDTNPGMWNKPQPRGGFPPNPGGFSGANSIMNNVANQGLLARLVNSQQPNNQPQFNPLQQDRVPANSLQVLYQQSRMAVRAGYLSSQILSRPLPQQSIYLLYQLLQQIEVFHQLTETQREICKSNSDTALQLSVQITKIKQAIANLHNQIAAQQAALDAKQQQQQQPNHPLAGGGGPGNPPNNDFNFKALSVFGDNRGVNNSGLSMMDPFMPFPNYLAH